MSTTRSKKDLILEYCRGHGLRLAGVSEVRAIRAELARQLGAAKQTSLSYIANVLSEAGVWVEYDDPFVDPPLGEPYAGRLKGLLQFGDLATAEGSIRKFDAAYRDYQLAGDRTGIALVRKFMLKGKQRAARVASNQRLSEAKRIEKREIESWFRVWLESPDLFTDWVELRKQSEEFERNFARPAEHKDQST